MHDNKIEAEMVRGNLHPFCDQLISNSPEMLNSEDAESTVLESLGLVQVTSILPIK